jgi:hypothetical protein
MAEQTFLRSFPDETMARKGIAGAVGGLVAGVAMGVVVQIGTDLMPLFGHFAGGESAVRGWLVHLVTSVLFGLLFAVFLSIPLFHDLSESLAGCVLLGIIHATILATVMIGIGLPVATIVLSAPQGVADRVPGPGFADLFESTVFAAAHLVYGLILGAVYAVLRDDSG